MIATTCEARAAETDAEAAPRRRGGGPQSELGRQRSRMNALKHGLRAKVLLPEDLAERVADHTATFGAELRPETPYQEWLVGEAALAAAKIDRCAELGLEDLARVVDGAEDGWDLDRRQAAEDLGAKLDRDPARIGLALRRTMHGTEWLIERWDGLAYIARTLGTWDATQRTLAFDLLGTPKELRAASPKLPADADGPTLAALADDQAAALRRLRDGYLGRIDERDRELTRAGLPAHEDAASARLRRYEADCRRSLRWALAEFRKVRPPSPKPAAPRPAPAPAPSPAPAPAPARDGRSVAQMVLDVLKSGRSADNSPSATEPTPAPAPALNRKARRAQERLARRAGR